MLGRHERIGELQEELSQAVPGSQDAYEIKKTLDLLASEERLLQRQVDPDRDTPATLIELEALRAELRENALSGAVDTATRDALSERIGELEDLLLDRGTDPDMPNDW